MLTYGTKFFTVFLILLSIVFQITASLMTEQLLKKDMHLVGLNHQTIEDDRKSLEFNHPAGLYQQKVYQKQYKMCQECPEPSSQGASYVLS